MVTYLGRGEAEVDDRLAYNPAAEDIERLQRVRSPHAHVRLRTDDI